MTPQTGVTVKVFERVHAALVKPCKCGAAMCLKSAEGDLGRVSYPLTVECSNFGCKNGLKGTIRVIPAYRPDEMSPSELAAHLAAQRKEWDELQKRKNFTLIRRSKKCPSVV